MRGGIFSHLLKIFLLVCSKHHYWFKLEMELHNLGSGMACCQNPDETIKVQMSICTNAMQQL